MHRTLASVTLLAPLALCIFAPDAYAQEWEQIRLEHGIRVWQRDVPGTSLVEFRAKATVKAPIQRVAAVIRNSDREKEWMESCSDSFTIQYRTPLHAITYNRTQSPAFFISDRDVVVEAKSIVVPDQQMLRVDFHETEHSKVPPREGVVRMPKLRGYWEMRWKDANRTEVTYQIQADPGGSLPKWIVNWASKSLSYETVRRLRRQVKRDDYESDLHVLEVAIDWKALEATPPAMTSSISSPSPRARSIETSRIGREARGGPAETSAL